MPCGSTTCKSTNTLDAPSSSVPDFGRSWKILIAWLAGQHWVGNDDPSTANFSKLDDRLLADIGVSRTAVKEVRRSQLYLIAWRDSR